MNKIIVENGTVTKYVGESGEIEYQENLSSYKCPPFLGEYDPFELTISGRKNWSYGELLSEGVCVINVEAKTKFICSDFSPNGSSFFKLLEEINVDPENTYCASEDGILYSKDKTILYACPASYKKAVVIPDTVKTIATRAFKGCKLIKEVIIPDSVTVIEEQAFADCKALKKVVLPKKLETLGKEAFLRSSKLLVAGPRGEKGLKANFEFSWENDIPENAFYGMRHLKKVVLPETIKSIGKNAFKGCKSLEEINLPEGVKCDAKTFKDCVNLSV